MELMEGLLTRRSVRKYQDKPIERETMMEIIKAAQYSPTAHNRQPWEFLVIDDREFLAELRHIQRWDVFCQRRGLRGYRLRRHGKIFQPQQGRRKMDLH